MGQKRRRIALSCVDCRKRKVKCDRTYPSCVRCQKGGYGDKCLYVSHTGAEPSDGLPTPEGERHRQSRAATEISQSDGEEQSQTAARSQEAEVQRQEVNPGTMSKAQYQPAPRPVSDSSQQKIAQLQGRLIELETLIHTAIGEPTSHETNIGLFNPMRPDINQEQKSLPEKHILTDHEKVSLRGESFKTQYLGPSNALAILLQFEDLSKFVREILLCLPSMRNTKRSMLKIREAEKQAARQQYDISIQSLTNMVPERSFADRLIHQYLDTIETTYRIVHVPTFLKDYEAFWSSPKDAGPGFVVQLLVCMACMYCIVPGGEEGYVGRSSARRETATYWINACSYWLEFQSKKHVSLVNYQLRIQLWLARRLNCIKVKRFWTDSGNLVRTFMAAGLHREPSLLCKKTNTFDCEMRRRLWYTVLEIDLQAAVDRGITPTIGPNDWDTNIPLNVDDEGFDVDSEELPEPKPRGTFTRTSFLAWAAENLPLRIELLYKINSIRNTLDHHTINLYDHKLRGQMDDIPLSSWQTDVRNESTTMPESPYSSVNSLSSTTSLIAIIMCQCVLYEYIVILHQAYPTDPRWRSQDFYSRVARRHAAISTIQLYNPQLGITDPHKRPIVDKSLYLNEVQRSFFSVMREDSLRAALCLAHSHAVSTSTSTAASTLHSADDFRLVLMIEAAVKMLDGCVRNLGQGFHGYWITSSALSFVHMKGSPDVPRSTFAHAAADRVIQLHGAVTDGQLPRARRMMLSAGQDGHDGLPSESPTSVSHGGNDDAAAQLEAISTVDGVVGIHQSRDKDVTAACMAGTGDTRTGATGDWAPVASGVPGINGGILGFDQLDLLQDAMFGLDNMDWEVLMNTDPTEFLSGGSGSSAYPS